MSSSSFLLGLAEAFSMLLTDDYGQDTASETPEKDGGRRAAQAAVAMDSPPRGTALGQKVDFSSDVSEFGCGEVPIPRPQHSLSSLVDGVTVTGHGYVLLVWRIWRLQIVNRRLRGSRVASLPLLPTLKPIIHASALCSNRSDQAVLAPIKGFLTLGKRIVPKKQVGVSNLGTMAQTAH